MIRKYRASDLDRLKEITAICFEEVSIDRNIESAFGQVGDHDWTWRKLRHIDADTTGEHAESVFVCEDDTGCVIGYITGRIDSESKIGSIPNLAVLPEAQGQGIGKALMDHLFEHFRTMGMVLAKIETLEQNPVGKAFYPSMGFEEMARQIHYAKKL